MDFAIFRLFIRVSLFVIALIACIIYLIKKRKLVYAIFFDKEAIKKESSPEVMVPALEVIWSLITQMTL